MTTTVATIDVDVPVEVAFDQWTRVEMFPAFLEDVESVTATTDREHHWVTTVGGATRAFDSTITEQIRDERVAWRGEGDVCHEGEVTFQRRKPDQTEITVRLELEPRTSLDRIAERLGVIRRRVQNDLRRFKQYVEARPTGVHLNATYRPTA